MFIESMESNSLKCSWIQTVHLIELKFGMHITSYRRINPIDFGEYRMNSFLKKYKKVFLYIRVYGVKLFELF